MMTLTAAMTAWPTTPGSDCQVPRPTEGIFAPVLRVKWRVVEATAISFNVEKEAMVSSLVCAFASNPYWCLYREREVSDARKDGKARNEGIQWRFYLCDCKGASLCHWPRCTGTAPSPSKAPWIPLAATAAAAPELEPPLISDKDGFLTLNY